MAKAGKRYFGSIRKLPSGRFQARYTGPDGRTYSARRESGQALTFETKGDAEAWLSLRHSEILRKDWLPPAAPKTKPATVREFTDGWLAQRDLEVRTREHYQQLLRDHMYPSLGEVPMTNLTAADVRAWHAALGATTGPTARAHAYGLLRTVLNTAVADDLIPANPCRVRGAGQSRRVKKIVPASLPELEVLVKAMPAKYHLMTLLAAWCALRFGELAEIRRSDVDVDAGLLHVRRGVVRTKTGRQVKGPKSEAGKRTVAIPPHLMPLVREHLQEYAATGRDGLLFPARHGEQLAPSTLYKVYYPAREKAGRTDLRFHDLRHTGATLAAVSGATIAELMARLGHSTPAAALRYQHAARDRDRVIADALSKLAVAPPSG
ncbi:site-specific integrase [Pseudonocardia sp. RS11V-5]|uniref:tyrosine-type recombinase/integrase n=1 Tax=Pseudonocardia terrae TaxID=2905831 RepID=UPI001E2A1F83|nr:site-specific integrase [Pseudonocardia terrae]MCE3555443.1 site-specific integrase [Pseudonocardia terrae]